MSHSKRSFGVDSNKLILEYQPPFSNRGAAWRLNVCVLIPCSLLAVLLARWAISGSFGDGGVLTAWAISMVGCFCVATCCAFTVVSRWRGRMSLGAMCLTPSLLLLISSGVETLRRNTVEPSNRFREHLANPLPKTLSGLHFLQTYESERSEGLFMVFAIGQSDLDVVLSSKGFVPVLPGHLCNPKDIYNDASRFKLGDGDQLYQARENFGGIVTLRVNKGRTFAVFRYEDENDTRMQTGFDYGRIQGK